MLRESQPDIVSVCTSTKPRAEVVAEMVEQMLVEEIPISIDRNAPVKAEYRPPQA